MTGTVLITDCDHATVEPETAILESAGFEVRRAACRTAVDVIREGEDAVALLTQYAPITADVLTALPQLQAVGRYGTGVDTIDVSAARDHGIRVVAVPGYARDEVADHTLALTLGLTRGIVVLDRAVRAGHWDFRVQEQLRRTSELTLGVVGLGSIGSAVAAKAAALGFGVVGHDPVVDDVEDIEAIAFDELLDRSDIVSLHVALSPGTTRLMDRAAFGRMRPGSYLVNTSRGGVVDETALVEALRSGLLAGAALDVLDEEPPASSHPLLGMEQVIITPHAAFYSRESIDTLKRAVAERLVDALAMAAPSGHEDNLNQGTRR